ncbi:MAG: hypothetical protein Q8K93_12510 [Reyranella sp.]|uniref:hypothetical protein n=1 Tax=Reyranella sp. TaxID=1929291 RepID=UPI002730C592|nr:hypothetical protein [Reyranella sp.]MDP1963012.1 hypothetical protein [Reyranella sp.]MDP2377441.1 hypothetical protein [Reyranella sp.]
MSNYTTFSAKFEREFEQERHHRLICHGDLLSGRNVSSDDVSALRQDGLLLKPGLLDRSRLLAVGARVDDFVRRLDCLGRLRHHRLELEQERLGTGTGQIFLDPAKITSEEHLAQECSNVSIRDPYLNLPEIIDLTLDPAIIGVATDYFGCVPVLSYVKVIKTFTGGIDAADTQFYHRDSGSYWILKAFIYLNDVDTNGGPFCYARTSHAATRGGSQFPDSIYARFDDADVAEMFGRNNITECVGDVGDVWFAETIGMHKGKRPNTVPRRIVILTFCVEKEKGFTYNPIKIRAADLARLSPLQRAVCDELEVVEEIQ